MCFVLLISGRIADSHLFGRRWPGTGPAQSFGYLSLFLASMLLLVVADNYVLLSVGWEGVGVVSVDRFLVPASRRRPPRPKAFVMNRVAGTPAADGMFLTFSAFGTTMLCRRVRRRPASRAVLTAIGLLMLLGGVRQVRRFRCKPDLAAMEAPQCPALITPPPW